MNSKSKTVGARGGFTLIELLVAMSIMVILSAAMAYVMAGAQEAAQVAKTRSLIARLHALVMQKYESYRYRRLPIALPAGLSPRQAAQVRCDVIRQLMRLEMPDRWSDITDPPKALTNPATGAPTIVMQYPACSQAYLAFYKSVQNYGNFPTRGNEYQGAKCLYLLVTMGVEENDVMENFSEGDIADFDKTGCKVFLDAWGNPIRFLRWAPGFVSPLQPAKPTGAQKDLRMPDQTDPMGVYGVPQNSTTSGSGKADTFALYPLIYSAGADGNYDIVSDMNNGSQVFHYSTQNPPNNPYASVIDKTSFPDGPIGGPAVFPVTDRPIRALGTSDNIHNHLIGGR